MQPQPFYENPHCIGTTRYHRTTCVHALVATDGVVEMFRELKSFWIGDVLASWLKRLGTIGGEGTFFVVRVIRDDRSKARFTIDDGDDRILIFQPIDCTDLPQNVKMYLVYCDETWIMMLPSEY